MSDMTTLRRAVAVQVDRELEPYDEGMRQVMQSLRNSLYPGAQYASIEMVLTYCRVNQIDPFLKAVHIVPMSVKKPGTRNDYEWRDVLMPGIADYRIKAARSGVYAGKSEPIFGPDVEYTLGTGSDAKTYRVPEWCKVVIKKMVGNHVAEFPAVEYWMENYATAGRNTDAPNSMWARRPRGQLSKCCEAQALRMAFPELTGGAPTAEEMEGKPYELASFATPNVVIQEHPENIRALEARLAGKAPDTPVETGSTTSPVVDHDPGVKGGSEPSPLPPDTKPDEWDISSAKTALTDEPDPDKWLTLLTEIASRAPTIHHLGDLQRLEVVAGAVKHAPPPYANAITDMFIARAAEMADDATGDTE